MRIIRLFTIFLVIGFIGISIFERYPIDKVQRALKIKERNEVYQGVLTQNLDQVVASFDDGQIIEDDVSLAQSAAGELLGKEDKEKISNADSEDPFDKWDTSKYGISKDALKSFFGDGERPSYFNYWDGDEKEIVVFPDYQGGTSGPAVNVATQDAIDRINEQREEETRIAEEERRSIVPSTEGMTKLSRQDYALYSYTPGSHYEIENNGGRVTERNRTRSIYGPDNVSSSIKDMYKNQFGIEPDIGSSEYREFYEQKRIEVEDLTLSLGVGGNVILRVREGFLFNKEGPDFKIYENPIRAFTTYLEFAYVEVGESLNNLKRFPCNLQGSPVTGCAGWGADGDTFDIAVLGLSRIKYIKIIDTGLNRAPAPPREDWVRICYDCAGFDLDAVELFHAYK